MNGVAPGYRRDEGTSRFRRRALSPMPLACCCGTAGRGHESELPSLRHRPHQIVRRVPAMSLLRRGCGIYAESAEPDRAAFRAHQSRVCPGTQQHQGPQQLWPALRTEINLSEAALTLSPSMTTPITQQACPRSGSSQMVPEEAHQHMGTSIRRQWFSKRSIHPRGARVMRQQAPYLKGMRGVLPLRGRDAWPL